MSLFSILGAITLVMPIVAYIGNEIKHRKAKVESFLSAITKLTTKLYHPYRRSSYICERIDFPFLGKKLTSKDDIFNNMQTYVEEVMKCYKLLPRFYKWIYKEEFEKFMKIYMKGFSFNGETAYTYDLYLNELSDASMFLLRRAKYKIIRYNYYKSKYDYIADPNRWLEEKWNDII